MRVPISTYRLQFHSGFGFSDAYQLLDYLSELGITDLYSSPVLKACSGSTHGYDITDPTQLNPEIGSTAEFDRLTDGLQARRMGLLMDIVPNHMAATVDNPWWNDVLRYGKRSQYADYFDVDWRKKILLPVLSKPFGEVLESGDLTIECNNGHSTLHYADLALPVTVPEGSNAATLEGLEAVLNAQPYRLAYWRKAADAINYRRFFDISTLIGLRTDREDVFRSTHALLLDLLAQGRVTGFRIDHIDGLRDPEGYLDRLPPVYVVAEKILGGKEQLPPNWRVWGTTGYDFLNIVNGVFVDRLGYEALKGSYAEFVGSNATITDVSRSRKSQVMSELFAGEVRALTDRLAELAEEDRYGRDLTRQQLAESLMGTTACLSVYRTYIRSADEVTDNDRRQIEDAIDCANRLRPSPAFSFLQRVLLLDLPHYLEHRRAEWFDFVLQWQQFTGPVMAKGLEDTTFYVYNPLMSVNEVGSDAEGPEDYFSVDAFHRHMSERRARWPFTMNATSTHDTKRSEDVRARIDVLSEIPDEWTKCVKRWYRWNATEVAPDRNEQVLIYQSLLGAWPIDAERFKAYVQKALREAKTTTSWVNKDEYYERRVLAFVDHLFELCEAEPAAEFWEDFSRIQRKVAFHGALSSLSQLVLKTTTPGVPDFYQGTELWDFSLADPDNRPPVDFELRVQMLQHIRTDPALSDLLRNWCDGRVKMYTLWKALTFRRANPDLFLRGDYIPLRSTGFRADNLVAFARRFKDDWIIIAVPRLTTQITKPGRWPIGGATWLDTVVEFTDAGPTEWRNVFTGDVIHTPLIAAKVFEKFPVAVLQGTHTK